MLLASIHALIVAICSFEVWHCALNIRRRVFRAATFLAIGVIFGLIPIITKPWHERLSLPYDAHIEAAWYTATGTFFLSLGAALTVMLLGGNRRQTPTTGLQRQSMQCKQRSLYALLFLAACIGLIGWAGTIYFSGASFTSAVSDGRFAFRGRGHPILVGLSGHLLILNYLVAFACWFVQNSTIRRLFLFYAILIATASYVLTSGTRFESIAIIGALISGYLFTHTLTLATTLKVAGVTIVVLALAAIAVPLRHRINTLQASEILPFIFSTERLDPILTSDPLNYHDTVIRVIDAFPDRYDFVNASTYRRILFFYIPSSFAPALKPPDPNRTVAQALFGYEAASSIDWMHPPGIFGDIWINFFGWHGCFLFIFWGSLLSYLDHKVSQGVLPLLCIAPLLGCLTILLVRGQPYQFCIKLLASYLLTSVILKLTPFGNSFHRAYWSPNNQTHLRFVTTKSHSPSAFKNPEKRPI